MRHTTARDAAIILGDTLAFLGQVTWDTPDGKPTLTFNQDGKRYPHEIALRLIGQLEDGGFTIHRKRGIK